MLWLVAVLLMPQPASGIVLNDGITATANLNVRATASANGTILATVPSGSVGLVIGGPTSADGYTWWKILWSPSLITGWSVQDYISTIATSGPNIYLDSLGSGWTYVPWVGSTVDLASSTHRNGSSGIAITTNAPSGFETLSSSGFNTAGYQTLRFSILNITGDGYSFYIALYDTNGSPIRYLQIGNYTGAGQVYQHAWYDIVIPLADLAADNRIIGGFVVQTTGPAVFYLDEISVSTTSGSSYWTPPTVTSVTVSCTPSSIPINGTATCSKTVTGTGNPDTGVTWYVNGIQNGNASNGTINNAYVSPPYTAPSTIPSTGAVVISGKSSLDPTKSASTTITITNPNGAPLRMTPIVTAIGIDGIMQSSNAQTSDTVFTDAIWSGWSIGTWNQVMIDPASDTSYRGANGIQVQIATAQGRIQFKVLNGLKFNTTGYDSVSFALNTGAYENESLTVGLLNANGTVIQYVPLASYTPTGTLDNSYAYQWISFRIPLANLGAANTNVYGIEIQSTAPATFFLDDVMFQPTGGCNGN